LEKLLAALAVLPFGLGLTVSADKPDAEVVFSFADPEIIESSGLVTEDGLFATINDSGDSGRVFTVDPSDGETVAVTTWDGEPEDVESLAPLPDGDLLVGDIGDNAAARDSVELLRVPFGEDGQVDPTTYELNYPDGSHDAEALLVHPKTGQVLVVAKEFIGRLYAAPEPLDPDAPNELEMLDGEVMPIVTDGAFLPDGKTFVLRGYGTATFYRWPSLAEIDDIALPSQEQGEGIAVGADGDVYLSSEGLHSEVLHLTLPGWLRAKIATGDSSAGEPSARPTDQPSDNGSTVDGGAQGSDDADDRPIWPWALGGIVGAVVLLVVFRSTRPR
jgi:hypothetical protein